MTCQSYTDDTLNYIGGPNSFNSTLIRIPWDNSLFCFSGSNKVYRFLTFTVLLSSNCRRVIICNDNVNDNNTFSARHDIIK